MSFENMDDREPDTDINERTDENMYVLDKLTPQRDIRMTDDLLRRQRNENLRILYGVSKSKTSNIL